MGDVLDGIPSDFVYGAIESQNVHDRQAREKDRSDESADMQRELRDVSYHGGVADTSAGPVDGLSRAILGVSSGMKDDDLSVGLDASGSPQLTDLKGRGNADKPALRVRENYVGRSGVGTGSLLPNTATDPIQGPETLNS